jgi:superfamily I DNA and/or RNA helicase
MLLLNIQYRMHRNIAAFPSIQFYNGKLLNSPQSEKYLRNNTRDPFWKVYHDDGSRRFRPLVLHNISNGIEKRNRTSYSNEIEVCSCTALF